MLLPTEIEGEVTFLGVNPDREAGLESRPIERANLSFDGIAGEAHGGATRPACSRVKRQYPRGTPLRNARQITILSLEEMTEVAAAMGLDAPIDPSWIGGNIQLTGIPQLTRIPPSSRLIFESGAGLVADMENAPCRFAAEAVEAHRPGLGLSFPKRAAGKRGVTAWVEREGAIALGMRCRLHIPPQRLYEPALRDRGAAE